MPPMADLIQQFKELGISERETKTYLALLEIGEANANELHRQTGLQRTKVYSILSRMVTRGLCHERVEGRNRFYSAVDPNTVLATLRDQWKHEVAQREAVASSLFSDLANRFRDHETADYLDSIEVLRNKTQIHRRYLSLVDECEHEICAFNRPPFAATSIPELDEQLAAQQRAVDRGVQNRSILIKGVAPIKEMEDEYPNLGESDHMRFAESLPIKLFVFDAKRAFLAIPSAPGDVNDFSMVLIDDAGFATLAQIAFEYYWDRAQSARAALEEYHNGTQAKTR